MALAFGGWTVLVDERQATVTAEVALRDLDAWRGLTSFVLGAIDKPHRLLDRVRRHPRG